MTRDPRFDQPGDTGRETHERGLALVRATVGDAPARDALSTWWSGLAHAERVRDEVVATAVDIVRALLPPGASPDDAFDRAVYLILADVLADGFVANPTVPGLRELDAATNRFQWTSFCALRDRICDACAADPAVSERVASVIEDGLGAALRRITEPTLPEMPEDPLDVLREDYRHGPNLESAWPVQVLVRIDRARFCGVVDAAASPAVRLSVLGEAQLESDVELLADVIRTAPSVFAGDGRATGSVAAVLAAEEAATTARALLRAIDGARHTVGANAEEVNAAVERAVTHEIPQRLAVLWSEFLERGDGLAILVALFAKYVHNYTLRPRVTRNTDDLAIVMMSLAKALAEAGLTPATVRPMNRRGENATAAVGEAFAAGLVLFEERQTDRDAILATATKLLEERNPHLIALSRSERHGEFAAERLGVVMMSRPKAFDEWRAIAGKLAWQRRREEFGRRLADSEAGACNEFWLRVGLYLCALRKDDAERVSLFDEIRRMAFRAHLVASGDTLKAASNLFVETFAFIPEVFSDQTQRVAAIVEGFRMINTEWALQIAATGHLMTNGVAIDEVVAMTGAAGNPLGSSLDTADAIRDARGTDHILPQAYAPVTRALGRPDVSTRRRR